ncbi:hypothetical protein VTO42DRAFT_5496 [Malbranchea cinnamomea]
MDPQSLRSSQYSYPDPRYLSSASVDAVPPPSKVLMEGYKGVLDSIQDEDPEYNSLSLSRPRNSVLLSASDPVVLHLLAETALIDSMQFEVLSFEEVETLKKELSLLASRIEGLKRKLTLEMKLHEAALSLSRLYDRRSSRGSEDYSSGGSPQSHRRQLSSFGRGEDAQSEVAISARKCEEFAQELWKAERRADDLRRRLLEHTAGVLQMTHKGLKKKSSTRKTDGMNGDVSPTEVDYFDDRSLYRTIDYLDEFPAPNGGKIVTSHNRGQSSVDLAAIHATTARLEDLNHRLRDMILESRPSEEVDPIPQNVANGTATSSMTAVQAHLDYLERGLESIAMHQNYPSQGASQPDNELEERLEDVNKRLNDILVKAGARPQLSSHTSSSSSRKTVSEQLETLIASIHDVQRRIENLMEQKTILATQIQQQRELNSKSDAERDAHIADLTEQIMHLRKDLKAAQCEASDTKEELSVVMGQLDSTRQQLMIQEQQRTADEVSRVSREELQVKEEEISRLEETIEQLRSESDKRVQEAIESKVMEIDRLEATVQQLRSENDERTKDALELKDEEIAYLQSAVEKLTSEKDQQIKDAIAEKEDEITRLEEALSKLRSENERRVQSVIIEKDEEIARLEDAISQLRSEHDQRAQELANKEDALAKADAALSELQSEQDKKVQEAHEAKEAAESNVKRLESEYAELEGEMIRLQTELTLAKAELDGAYGTRAQRAAEVAANPAIQKEIEELSQRNLALTEELAALKAEQGNKNNNQELQRRVQLLEAELKGTIEDYEALTKASIEFEKERDKLESMIDSYRDRCEELESQLYDERIQALGNNGGAGLPPETTSTMVLKTEFKKMMREARAESLKALKAEQEERRRLEGLLRSLKKEQAAARSNLSQSTTASS